MASEGIGWRLGGSRVKWVEMLTDHGRCCFVWLLGYQPLKDGICDDVLDVIEGIAGETVIELTQEENNMRERCDSGKKCIGKKRCDTLGVCVCVSGLRFRSGVL
jgi:hypothetical protein